MPHGPGRAAKCGFPPPVAGAREGGERGLAAPSERRRGGGSRGVAANRRRPLPRARGAAGRHRAPPKPREDEKTYQPRERSPAPFRSPEEFSGGGGTPPPGPRVGRP